MSFGFFDAFLECILNCFFDVVLWRRGLNARKRI